MNAAESNLLDDVFVAHANFYQFGRKEEIAHSHVESRMFLWVRKGRGWMTVNGRENELGPGDFLLLPWAHRISYAADGRDPFFVGGIHLIPRQRREERIFFEVAHRPDDALARRRSRRDFSPSAFPDWLQGKLPEGRLLWLASYIVDFFQHAGPDEFTMRALGRTLAQEILLLAQAGRAKDFPLPAALQRMIEYARTHPASPLTIDHLAAIGESSAATVHRHFQRFLGISPYQFIAGLRIEQARHLLRTTRLPVNEVGRRVGFGDPFHFSRFYKGQTGLSPLAYRQRAALL